MTCWTTQNVCHFVVQVELTLPHPSRRELAQYLKGLGIVVNVQDPIASPVTSFQTRTSQTAAEDRPLAATPAASSSTMANSGSLQLQLAETQSTDVAATDDPADEEAASGASSESVPASEPPPAAGTPSQPPAARLRQSKLRYQGQEKDYPKPAKEALETILNAGLLDGVTPRQIKRLLNRYLLAKYIIMAQVCTIGHVEHCMDRCVHTSDCSTTHNICGYTHNALQLCLY